MPTWSHLHQNFVASGQDAMENCVVIVQRVKFQLKKIWQTLEQYVDQFGKFDSALYILDRLFARLPFPLRLTKFYLVAQPVSSKPLFPEHRAKHISVKLIVEEPKNPQAHPCPRPEPVIAARYLQSAICIGAYAHADFAGCLWLVKGQYEEDVVRCTFVLPATNSIWDFDAYVDPQYRMSPVFLKLWNHAYYLMREENIAWSISRISAFNTDSRKVHRRMGAVDVASITFISIGSWQITLSGSKPYVHLSLSHRSIPVFDVLPPL
jgi:hypothetical protein